MRFIANSEPCLDQQFGSLARKLRVSGNAPTVAPFQFDAFVGAKCARLDRGNIDQMLGNQPPIPAHIARRCISIKELQRPSDCDFIKSGRLSTARRTLQSSDSATQKPQAPLADRHFGNAQTFANLTSTAAFSALRIIWPLILSRCSIAGPDSKPSNSLRFPHLKKRAFSRAEWCAGWSPVSSRSLYSTFLRRSAE